MRFLEVKALTVLVCVFFLLGGGLAFGQQGKGAKKLPLDCTEGQVAKWNAVTDTWVCDSRLNPQQVALLRWYEASEAGNDFAVGNNPFGVAFDGANIWVVNFLGATVSKLRASDGMTLGTFATGDGPVGVAFDGANIWVTNEGDDTVSKH